MTKIVFEAGANHTGFESAKNLIDIAAEAGGDCVKFQMLDPDVLMRDANAPFDYQRLDKNGLVVSNTRPLKDILSERYLTRDEFRLLKIYADDKGIEFFCTVLHVEDVEFLESIGCQKIKICSSDINYMDLLQACGGDRFEVHIDTGNATLTEISSAIDTLRGAFQTRIVIHHCPSGYPAITPKINLKHIKTLSKTFGLPVAYSDHSPDMHMDIVAVAYGAAYVEKTITEDKTQDGPEHLFSLEKDEAKEFVRAIHNVSTALGTGIKTQDEVNFDGRMIGRRVASANTELLPGSLVMSDNVDFTRPAVYGAFAPDMDLYGKRVKRLIKKGEVIKRSDV